MDRPEAEEDNLSSVTQDIHSYYIASGGRFRGQMAIFPAVHVGHYYSRRAAFLLCHQQVVLVLLISLIESRKCIVLCQA